MKKSLETEAKMMTQIKKANFRVDYAFVSSETQTFRVQTF